jgi:predicted nucleic acid-binding protein
MNGRVFVDTNILVYAHDESAGPKHERASALLEQIWNSGEGVLSTQVLQEFCVSIRRKAARPLAAEQLRQLISDYLSWEIVINTPQSVIQALELEQTFQISFWDALILQAADTSGASVLYSEDFSGGRSYGSVRVINPFSTQPGE